MENVEHHAVEEEEEKIVPLVRELMDEAALEELGQELEAAKGKEVGLRKCWFRKRWSPGSKPLSLKAS
jgi:hypothetical protein